MGVMRDTSESVATQRRLEVVVQQLLEAFGARGRAFYFGINDADQWAELQLWAAGARRSVEVAAGKAAEAIHIDIGGTEVHVQGPVREATMDDYRRKREQEQC